MSVSLFIPSRDALYDPAGIADALSESHANEYGSWNGEVELSGSHVICRNNSLQIGQPYYTGFYFGFTTPINMIGFDRIQFAIAGLNTSGYPSLAGTGVLSIWDTANRLAVANFTMSTDGNYTRKQFVLSDFAFIDAVSGWPVTDFNWQSIKRWYIEPSFLVGPSPQYYAWLDEGPFVKFTVVSPVLSISAEDVNGQVITYGKHAQLIPPTGGGETIMLPWTNLGRIISPGTWTITALDEDFVRWKDGITARARTVELAYGGTVNIVAVFQSGSTNGLPDNTWIWALGLGIVSVLGVGAYIWFRRRRRK